MRLATDTGGTFTDLIVEDDEAGLSLYKAATTTRDPIQGVLDVLALAARDRGCSLEALLRDSDTFIHGTTHALNAVITGNTARTALLTTRGHRDILVFRGGGRRGPFDHTAGYPAPYVPRHLTFEVEERLADDGSVVVPFSDASVLDAIRAMGEAGVEAVAVCLLWSVVNPMHELRVGALLEQHLPGIPYTLSSQLNPVLREYRRASAASLDASLKPIMARYIGELADRLEGSGFRGRVQILTSLGGLKNADEAASAPVQLLMSGPSMAPVAGRYYAGRDGEQENLIVTDSGGTTYDVSLVHRGEIPKTRETWIGREFDGHITGLPSIDVKSIGAGGGSVAWVDEGGVLHVGPQSQGADPGPACYGRAGGEATFTDAAVVLGYIDPDFFLGGRFALDCAAATRVVEDRVARPLGIDVAAAAASIVSVATENMVQAILDITVERGVDPASSTLVGGGGAAGLNAFGIARRLGCRRLVFTEVRAALSTGGAIVSDLTAQFSRALTISTRDFDRELVNGALRDLEKSCLEFAANSKSSSQRTSISYSVEARYKNQVWEIEIPLRGGDFPGASDLAEFASDFHANHERIFAISDPDSPIEIQTWLASVRCRLRDEGDPDVGCLRADGQSPQTATTRRICLLDGSVEQLPVLPFHGLEAGVYTEGPAMVETPFTSIVIDRDAVFSRSAGDNLVVELR